MAGKSPITASAEQRAGLLALADSRDRGEADRARAVLLTLAGWTSSKIAEAFGVREDTVRLWRSDFTAGGVAALKTSIAPGPPPVKSEAALRVVTPLLEEPVADRRRSPAFAPRSKRARAYASAVRNCPRPCEKKVPLAAAAAHAERTSDGKRDGTRGPAPATAQTAGRGGGHRSSLRRRERSADPSLSRACLGEVGGGLARAGARASQEDRDAGVARSPHPPTHRSYQPDQAEQRFHRPSRATRPSLWTAARATGQAGRAGRGQWSDPHQQTLAPALAARAHWLTVEWLPKYAPELNEIEPVWRDLKAHHLAHQTFTDLNALDQAIHDAVIDLNRERTLDPLAKPRISA